MASGGCVADPDEEIGSLHLRGQSQTPLFLRKLHESLQRVIQEIGKNAAQVERIQLQPAGNQKAYFCLDMEPRKFLLLFGKKRVYNHILAVNGGSGSLQAFLKGVHLLPGILSFSTFHLLLNLHKTFFKIRTHGEKFLLFYLQQLILPSLRFLKLRQLPKLFFHPLLPRSPDKDMEKKKIRRYAEKDSAISPEIQRTTFCQSAGKHQNLAYRNHKEEQIFLFHIVFPSSPECSFSSRPLSTSR